MINMRIGKGTDLQNHGMFLGRCPMPGVFFGFRGFPNLHNSIEFNKDSRQDMQASLRA